MYAGPYRSIDDGGKIVFYDSGTTVSYVGRVYECTTRTSVSPLENPGSWKYTGVTVDFTGTTPPPNPVENQGWIDDQGRQYRWYFDGNSYAWVQV